MPARKPAPGWLRVGMARYALLLDPLTAAVCAPAEISALFDEMWQAEHAYLQPFE